jgi:PKD repeat protein
MKRSRTRNLPLVRWVLLLLLLILPVILVGGIFRRDADTAAQQDPPDRTPYGFIDQAQGRLLIVQLTAGEPDYGATLFGASGTGLFTLSTAVQVTTISPTNVQLAYDGPALLDIGATLDTELVFGTHGSGQATTITVQFTATLNPERHTGTAQLTYGGQQYDFLAVEPPHNAEAVLLQIVSALNQQDGAQIYSLADRRLRGSVSLSQFTTGFSAELQALGPSANARTLVAPTYGFERWGYSTATGVIELTSSRRSAVAFVYDEGGWKLKTFLPVPADQLSVVAGGPYTVAEGQSIAVAATALNPIGGSLTYAWDLDGNGSFETAGQSATFTAASLDGPANRTVGVRVTSSSGAIASGQTTVTVANAAPTATLAAPATVTAGQGFTLGLTNAQDVAADQPTLQFAFDCGDGAGYGPLGSAASRACPTAAGQAGTRTVRGKVRDKDGGEIGYAAAVAVVAPNLAPVVGTIAVPAAPAARGTASAASAPFTDPNPGDTHTATWAWGDGTTSAGAVSEANGAGTVTGSHTYAGPGVYTITLTVADQGGATGTATATDYVVVYDPDGGFVTGGGWITAPAGTCQQASLCGTASGKATFGLNAKYPPHGSVPTGNTEFQVGTFRLQSTGYDWLVVSGATAQVRGTATVNGAGSYAFLLAVGDGAGGGADTFRLKVWDVATGTVVYDTQPGAADTAAPTTPLGGGAIVIHQP